MDGEMQALDAAKGEARRPAEGSRHPDGHPRHRARFGRAPVCPSALVTARPPVRLNRSWRRHARRRRYEGMDVIH
jgi:hypothetical protein